MAIPRIFADHLPVTATPRAARTVQRILDAAAQMFGAEGYQRASMGSVARAAGVSKGLLHYHFRSKEHLLIEAGRATFRQIHRRFDERFSKGDVGLPTALEGLDALWLAIREMEGWTPFMVETLSLATQSGPVQKDLQSFYSETMTRLVDGIETVFAEETDQLVFPPERLAYLIRISLIGLAFELAQARDGVDTALVDQAYADIRTLFSRFALSRQSPSPTTR